MIEPASSRVIEITQAESKQALAILAHLRMIYRTVTIAGQVLLPTDMDQADLLLCAAALRCLLFDENPVLVGFLGQRNVEVEIEALETNANLLFLTQFDGMDRTLADYLPEILISEEGRKSFQVNDPQQTFLHVDRGAADIEEIRRKPHLWRASDGNASLTFANSTGGAAQWTTITRRRKAVAEWGSVTLGHLKDIPITRARITSYVANQLGGVHYDSKKRLPKNSEDAKVFPVLATVLDWNSQAVMHGALSCIGYICIELLMTKEIAWLLQALEQFQLQRQHRLAAFNSKD